MKDRNAPTARSLHREGTAERIYVFVRAYFAEYGYSPCMDEIAESVFMSRATVMRYVDLLEARGYITREPGVPRSIAVVPGKKWKPRHNRRKTPVRKRDGCS